MKAFCDKVFTVYYVITDGFHVLCLEAFVEQFNDLNYSKCPKSLARAYFRFVITAPSSATYCMAAVKMEQKEEGAEKNCFCVSYQRFCGFTFPDLFL